MPRIKLIRSREQQARIQAELREARAWRRWELGRSRCPYCLDLSVPDWKAVCDCWMIYEDD